MTKRVSFSALALVFLAGFITVLADPAAAGDGYPPCGPACDRKDPQTYEFHYNPRVPDRSIICSASATNKGTASTANATITLRYSTACETTWGRYAITGTPFVETIHQSKYTDGTMRVTLRNETGIGSWTLMLNDHNLLNRVCLHDYYTEENYVAGRIQEIKCTVWY